MKYLKLLVLIFVAESAFADDITFVDQCGFSSSADYQSIVVTNDIQLTNFGAPCIDVSHEDVTLDCQGFVLSAPLGGLGIGVRVLDEAHNVTIRNCIF